MNDMRSAELDVEEPPVATALIYASEVYEMARERGVELSDDQLDSFCGGDVFDNVQVAMIERAWEYIGAKLDGLKTPA